MVYSDEKVLELKEVWDDMTECLWDEEFDYGTFRKTAKDTFEIIFEFVTEANIPKSLLELMLSINTFGVHPTYGYSAEADAARIVAIEFCNQISEWRIVLSDDNKTGLFDKSIFVVTAENGKTCIINTETFDLQELIDNRIN